jgi:hypothetical protein
MRRTECTIHVVIRTIIDYKESRPIDTSLSFYTDAVLLHIIHAVNTSQLNYATVMMYCSNCLPANYRSNLILIVYT